MSPEQATGEGDSDPRSDVYSLGAVAYFLLTGRPPFDSDKPLKVILAHSNEKPIAPSQRQPEIGHDLDMAVLRCLEKTRWIDSKRSRNWKRRWRPAKGPTNGIAITPRAGGRVRVCSMSPKYWWKPGFKSRTDFRATSASGATIMGPEETPYEKSVICRCCRNGEERQFSADQSWAIGFWS